MRQSHQFYRRTADGIFKAQPLDDDGYYRTPLLPGFALHVPTLWEQPLPDIFGIIELVKRMVAE